MTLFSTDPAYLKRIPVSRKHSHRLCLVSSTTLHKDLVTGHHMTLTVCPITFFLLLSFSPCCYLLIIAVKLTSTNTSHIVFCFTRFGSFQGIFSRDKRRLKPCKNPLKSSLVIILVSKLYYLRNGN